MTQPTPSPTTEASPGAPAATYQYTPDERRVSRDIAGFIRFFSGAWILLGGIFGALSLVGLLNLTASDLNSFAWWAGLLFQGIFARRAQLRFAAIGEQAGDDITQTMEALRALDRYYTVVGVVLTVQIVTTIAGLF